MKSKMKVFIALSAVIVCSVYLLSHAKTASAAKGPKVTDKVGCGDVQFCTASRYVPAQLHPSAQCCFGL